MSRKRNLLISIVAALLAGLLVYAVYTLQLRQLRLQETVEVVVPSRFIAAGERLTAELLTTRTIAMASYDSEMFTDPASAIGLETAVPLGEGEPLRAWKVSSYRLLPEHNESTFQIPREYVLSISSGIRAGDRVVLFVSGSEAGSERLFGGLVTVASVKTSGNQEVDDPDNPNLISLANGDKENMYASRRDANAMIDHVNLNLTETQWLEIDRLCRDGAAKLVIAFSPLSMEPEESRMPGDAEGEGGRHE
ncbi:flagellar biosynthesis protein FlgA [Paenibacillus sp. IB182496]|uniref:Flagellar biosynthesis protein FlgA n=1 Tax=Paenibacillus sabuli TaxID=2772509 RepID=A0A927GTY2_9BACL|nr:SAF domain-containing protein [Paenibacillus sabuli]MBD2847786.1 flagellar biosynthesis protein FlgA [Paenibacillus sabuli]